MNLCVLGWYGTETLGDRAILDGILEIFSPGEGSDCKVSVGSLYPFVTERTLLEDSAMLERHGCELSLFDELSRRELEGNIRRADVVVMGGGPLMAIHEMHVIHYAFKRARRLGKKTALLGVGYGPFNSRAYIELTGRILSATDLAIFRDTVSLRNAVREFGDRGSMLALDDPAIISALSYRGRRGLPERDDCAAINFREFPAPHYGPGSSFSANEAASIVNSFAERFGRALLVPMHSYFVGGDDRAFLFDVSRRCASRNVEVVSSPPSLEGLYGLYSHAAACVGMRYHAVVLQTVLNGNNFVVDYTGEDGKIDAFIGMYDEGGALARRKVVSIGAPRSMTPVCASELNGLPPVEFDLGYDPAARYRRVLESEGML